MSEQHPPFVYEYLQNKLQQRLVDALRAISSLSTEDILRCDSGCLTEIIRQFVVAPPILRSDLIVADEKIREAEDIISERKTGDALYSFFIPVEREAEWLEEVDVQITTDGKPLAFLDRERDRIAIRLMVSLEDEAGTLRRKLDYRNSLVEQYADSVAARIIEFNKELAERMATELNGRKGAILKAEKELENVGLPRVYNPEHAEWAVKIERIRHSLGAYVTDSSSRDEEPQAKTVRAFIVHGHDGESLYELKDYLQNTLGLDQPVVLRDTPGLGKTIIEKFEREAEAIELVLVLLTPDDEVVDPAEPDANKRRARQNVILELGYFLGKLGRESGKILLLHKGPTEIPSDIAGVEYIDITNGIKSAGENVRKELRALGILA
jgi:predicted nucleotide-binding protein